MVTREAVTFFHLIKTGDPLSIEQDLTDWESID